MELRENIKIEVNEYSVEGNAVQLSLTVRVEVMQPSSNLSPNMSKILHNFYLY